MNRDMHELLDAYLDGLLGPEDLAAFESAMRRDPSLRAAVDAQRLIDQSIARRFGGAPKLAIPGAAEPARPIPFKLPRWWLAAAAAIALAAVGGWALFIHRTTPRFDAPRILAASDVYANLVTNGFEPTFVCTTDPEFQEAVRQRFGQALSLRTEDPGIELAGWAYSDAYNGSPLSSNVLVLMAKVDGRPVIVLMDRLESDRAIEMEGGCGLLKFRAEIGAMVVYEITPLSAPRIVNRLVDPDA